jgi:phosphoesterase RecJ-like protein
MTTMTVTSPTTVTEVADAIRSRRRFVLTSHVRPDGDAIGCELAMAYALRHLGKEVRVVNRDPVPMALVDFPGVEDIIVADHVDDPGDAVIVMECGDLDRTGVAGLDRGFVINIDHHLGNTMYGALNWFDQSAAACGEMVFSLIQALGVPLSREMATHIYVAILTDTGSFHYSSISPRTFDICRQCTEAGVHPPTVARSVFDSSTLGGLKLYGAVLNGMEIDPTGRLAILAVDRATADACGGAYEDLDGLNNLPLTVKAVQAVAFLKEQVPGHWRISMRSKGDVDVREVATRFGGGGHRNAAGCSADGVLADVKAEFRRLVLEQIERAERSASSPNA